MMTRIVIFVLAILRMASGEFNCLCSFSNQTIYSSPSPNATVLGSIYESCLVVADNVTDLWVPVVHKHQIGYCKLKNGLGIDVCQDDPPDYAKDILTKPLKRIRSLSAGLLLAKVQSVKTTPSSTRPKSATPGSGTTTVIQSTPSLHPLSTNVPATLTGNVSLCPSSVVQYAQQDGDIVAQKGHSCYTVVPHRCSWARAETDCYRRGGFLFHIKDSSENLFIFNLLNTRFNHTVWMGLHDTTYEEHFKWISGIPVTYTNWMPGRYNDLTHGYEDCVVFLPFHNHGQWDDVQCGGTAADEHYYICQFPTAHQCPRITLSSLFAGDVLDYHNNSCYERVSTRRTWNEAERDCIRKGGHLLDIGSAQEETYIKQFLSRTDSQHAVWIGLHDQGHEETFTWTTGAPLTYTNWIPGRKGNYQSSVAENCVVLLPYKQGMWDDIACGDFYVYQGLGYTGRRWDTHPYICEYDASYSGSPGLIGK